MIGILLVSHEPLGTALLNCTRHIFGRLPVQLAALDVIPDEDPQAALAAARELLARINDGTGALVLTDVYGATPSRIAVQLADPGRVAVLAGVNLPLLIKALSHRRGPLGELVDTLIESGQRAILEVGLPARDEARATGDTIKAGAGGGASKTGEPEPGEQGAAGERVARRNTRRPEGRGSDAKR